MKILFFTNGLLTGGKERRLLELMKVLQLTPDIEFELALMDQNVQFQDVFTLDVKIHYLIKKKKKDISILFALFKLCKAIKPDILHCWDGMTAIYSVPVCKILNIPLINGMVTNSPKQQNIFNPYWLRAKLTFPFSTYIIGNSKAGILAYNAPPKKSCVINNGFSFNRIEDLTSMDIIKSQLKIETRFVVGMVASFSKFKDYDTYFAAAQQLLTQRTDVTFLAIGSRTDSERAKSYIDNKNARYFRLLGNKPDIESYVNLLDIGVLSTFTEGISNSILEYMALGKPVIATNGGGTNEIIVDKVTGFLVGVSNPNELSDKMQVLLQNDVLRSDMGNAGKKRIQDDFSMDAMLSKYISLYEEIHRSGMVLS
jgi:glycosyltransferase involved in cell wall biosynthesis